MINRTTGVLTHGASHPQAAPQALQPALPHIQHVGHGQQGAIGGTAIGNVRQARNTGAHHAMAIERQNETETSSSDDEFMDETGDSEFTPLYAVEAEDLLLLQILLNSGIDVNQRLESERTLLMHASQIGSLDVVAVLLAAGAGVNEQHNQDKTALMLASEEGHAGIVRALLAADAGVDQETLDGSTALMFAAMEGHAGIVTLLIEAGANILHADLDNATALQFAAESGHADVVIAIIRGSATLSGVGPDRSSALAIAAINGHLDVVNALISAKADVNDPGTGFETPLMNAAINGHVDVVRALIAAGADLERVHRNLGPPFVFAAMSGHADVAEALIAAGANINVADGTGMTALMHAVRNDHAGIAASLLAAGADVSMCTNDGFTALGLATFYRHSHVAGMLLPHIVIAMDASQSTGSLSSSSREDRLRPFAPHPLFEGHEGELTCIVADYLSGDAQSLDRFARVLTEYDQQACWQSHIDRIMSCASEGSGAVDWLLTATINNDAEAVIALLAASFYSDQARAFSNSVFAPRSGPGRTALDLAALEHAIEEGLKYRCHDDILATLMECRSRHLVDSSSEQQRNRSWLSRCLFDTARRYQAGEKLSAIDTLLAHGADVNMVHRHATEVGPTVAYVACRRQQVSLLRHLLERNANTEATDIFQNTAAHLAATMSNSAPDMMRMLQQAGADMHARNARGLTPHYILHQVLDDAQIRALLMTESGSVEKSRSGGRV
jgi:uncharacterized protein